MHMATGRSRDGLSGNITFSLVALGGDLHLNGLITNPPLP